jgi:hypothetical protein
LVDKFNWFVILRHMAIRSSERFGEIEFPTTEARSVTLDTTLVLNTSGLGGWLAVTCIFVAQA